ncbi:hypothetical protein ACFFX1_55480 [Dactylosporangium sucinum]|uniref:Uncharacterized protein n=1 Tax=Dactylosporangium sucinum TaxID=1424081 RepID=A0A917U1X6_9ACTN|nr:hypothetical protein [Dactylosporangium sucinum]GGM52585.1 hypothetical protein GCM10007977_062680 [Dactylosporangium sucinum]
MRVHVILTGDVRGHRGLIVEDATADDVASWRRTATETPDATLTFERARIHLGLATFSRGSCRAGDIVDIRPI